MQRNNSYTTPTHGKYSPSSDPSPSSPSPPSLPPTPQDSPSRDSIPISSSFSSSSSSSASSRPIYANSRPDQDVIYPNTSGRHQNTVAQTANAKAKSNHESSSATNRTQSSNSSSSSTSSSSSSSSSRPNGPTSASISATYQKKSEPVFLNVYDLHPYNQYLHSLGFGAYHSAVEIFGREYSFGFHDTTDTGVFSMMPKNVPNAVFRESIEVGNIYLTYNQFNLILNQLKADWTGNKYHLLRRSQ